MWRIPDLRFCDCGWTLRGEINHGRHGRFYFRLHELRVESCGLRLRKVRQEAESFPLQTRVAKYLPNPKGEPRSVEW